ncbi:MAG: caspase family protein [Cytophagaceae bacterium]|jgi:WD40 repeat protein|nr:caspase family protein [Cytophagaceae bacterium]
MSKVSMSSYKIFTIIVVFIHLIQPVLGQTQEVFTVIQQGHSAAVKTTVVSPTKKLIATTSRDKTIKLWDALSGLEIRTFYGHEHTVNDAVFSSNENYLATSSADNTVILWSIIEGKAVWRSPDHNKYATSVDISKDTKWLVYGGYFDSLYVVQIPSGKVITQIETNADQGSGYGIDVQFSPDMKWLAVGEDNKTIRVYSTTNWKLAYTFTPEKGWCGGCGTLVSFTEDSKFILRVSHNDTPTLFSLETNKAVATYGNEVDDIYGVSIIDDYVILATDTTIRTYVKQSGKEIRSVTIKPKYKIHSTRMVDATSAWLSMGNNQSILLRLTDGAEMQKLEGFARISETGGITYDADSYWDRYIALYLRYKNKCWLNKEGTHLYTGKSSKDVIGWNTLTGAPDYVWGGHEKAIIAAAFSPDGKRIAVADGAGKIYIHSALTGKVLRTISAHREVIFDLAFHPNGLSLASASWDATVRIWNVETGELENTIDFENQSVYCLTYSPDGLYLVVAQLDKSVSLIEPDTKKPVRTYIGHTDIVSSIRFGKDRNQLLTTSWDGSTRLWELATGLVSQKFKSSGKVHAAVFFQNNTKVITVGEDRIVRIWNVADGKLLQKLSGHTSEITDIQLSSDHKTAYTYSVDGVLKCWNLETNTEIFEHIHLSAKDWMAKTPEGFFVATEGARQSIHFVRGLEAYRADQFFEKYYKPDLIQQMIQNRGTAIPSQSIQGSLDKFPPPIVKIATVLSTDGIHADIMMKITNTGGGIQKVKLFQNGKVIHSNFDTTTFAVEKGQSVNLKYSAVLIKGHNHFSATAQSKAGIETMPVESMVYSDKAPHATKCHVFVMGINAYQNPVYQLNYAKQDAVAFAEILKKESKDLFEEVVIHELYDAAVNKKNVIDTLKALQQTISYNDVFVLYYAGHGVMVEGTYYFITANCPRMYDGAALKEWGLSAIEIQQQLALIKALKQVIVIDACQSGGSVEVLAMRGVSEERAFAQLSRSVGIHVLAAAAGDQSAKEITELKHGLFTYLLLKGMTGEADGAPQDGKITLYELKSYLDDQVPQWSTKYGSKSQYPYTFSRGGDFPIILK